MAARAPAFERTCLQHEDWLDARGRSRRRHEFPAMGVAFDIKQDGPGVRIGGEVVEHVAEIDIRHISERDDM